MNHFIMRYLYIVSFLFVSFALSAQGINFQRTFELETRDMLHGSMSVAADGSFFLINLFEDPMDNDLKKFHVTKHAAKGDLMWAFDYQLQNVSESINFDMDILATDDRGAVFTVIAKQITTGPDIRYVVKLSSAGVVEWSQELGGEDGAAANIDNVEIITSFTSGYILGSDSDDSISDDNFTGQYLSSIDQEGQINWSKGYVVADTLMDGDTILQPIESTRFSSVTRSVFDFTMVTCGVNFNGDGNYGFISKIDPDGNLLWSKSYQFIDSLVVNPTLNICDVAVGPDGTIAMAGSIDLASEGFFQPFIVKVDTIGEVMWSEGLKFGGNLPVARHTQVTVDNVGGIVVSGRYLEGFVPFDYMSRYSSTGDLLWTQSFPRINSYLQDPMFGGYLKGGELQSLGDGYMFSANAINFASEEGYPFVVRTNEAGEAQCEQSVITESDSLNIVADTLMWLSGEYLHRDSLTVDVDTSINYSLPILVLPDIPFCPGDAINVLLEATQRGAISYEWDSGETTDTLRVTEDGEYIVTVTMDTLECFMMCDTALITVFDEPIVSIIPNFSQYCTDGTISLAAAGNQGQPPYTLEWSTGDMNVNQIITTELGAYSVTVTDQCDNTAVNTFTITDNILPQPVDPVIDFNQSFFCTTGQYQIAILNSNDYDNIVWSTGDMDVPSIIVPGPGDYSVTATNCLEDVSGSINADGFNELEPLEVSSLSDNEMYCENMTFPIDLTITGGSEVYMVEWNTGQTGPSIIVPTIGTYVYTVSDDCDNIVVDSILLSDDLIPPPVDPILEFNGDSYCTTQLFGINLVNADEFTDIQWSNGQSDVPSIFVSETGEYMVTALSCFQEVTGQFNIGESAIPPPVQPILDYDPESFCNDGLYDIIIVNADEFTNIEWSNGESDVTTILTSEPGEYTVTAVSCFQDVTASQIISEGDEPEPALADLSFNVDSFCLISVAEVELTNPDDFDDYVWSNGQSNQPIILVDEITEYFITVTDCSQEEVFSISLELSDEEKLKFPNVFIPNSTEDANRSFGPYAKCPDLIDDYELKVFNRWGALMFEADRIDQRWNGAANNKNQPNDVYFWYCRYTGAFGNVTDEGDVVLLTKN